jgi:hypothetical protein
MSVSFIDAARSRNTGAISGFMKGRDGGLRFGRRMIPILQHHDPANSLFRFAIMLQHPRNKATPRRMASEDRMKFSPVAANMSKTQNHNR